MKNLIIYLFGALVVATGIGLGMHQLGVPPIWIGIMALVIIGFGIMGGVRKTQEKSDPDSE